ncbi:hypothetical protein NECAME_10631, partial [Necator americanus]
HLKLEYSGKWGDTIEGIRQLSAAFYIEIGKYLKDKHKLVVAPTMDQLFVVKDGVVFKLVLVLDKISKLLEQRVAEVKASGAPRIEMSAEGQRLTAWKKLYVHEALLQASLQSFATKHLAFGETVQIIKKWLSIHLLTGAISDLALEMIVAAAFEHPVLPPPQTALAAFRRVLQLVSKHNWTARPLFMDFDCAWNEEEIAKLESNFVKMRPILPPMVIITNEDPVGSRYAYSCLFFCGNCFLFVCEHEFNEPLFCFGWTRDGPTPLLLKRIIALAKSMLEVLDMNYGNAKAVDVKSALTDVDMSVYDAIIEIFPKMVVRTSVSEKTPTVNNPEALPVVNFNPVDELVYALNAHFEHIALFFWNKYGGNHIGLIWKPYEVEVPAKTIVNNEIHEKGLSRILPRGDEIDYLKEQNGRHRRAGWPANRSAGGSYGFGYSEHPRFSKFKNAGRAAEQQAKRREDAMERQRNSRFDHFNHTRKLAENEDDDESVIEPEGDHQNDQEKAQDLRKKRFKSRYADELMLSEWLVDIPEQLSSEWMMVPSPVGKRVLVVAAKGATTAYNKAGKTITQFRSRLPGGYQKSSVYTILDCIMDAKKTFYCLDVLAWNGMDMSANPFDFRQYMLSSKLKESPEISLSSKQFPYRFLSLPCCKCERALMEEMMRNGFDFELDGLLYYHSGVVYEAGQSPLVGWLKPWMLPEILNVTVPEKFLNENVLQQSSQQFIDAFNIEHRHVSKIEKNIEMEEVTSA